jgi:hypothetical protein
MSQIVNITVTFAGETRTVKASVDQYGRAFGVADGEMQYGVFPTGTKAHRQTPEFTIKSYFEDPEWPKRRVPYGAIIGTDENGTEWVMNTRLYTHNRNHGRIVGWADKVDPKYIARW